MSRSEIYKIDCHCGTTTCFNIREQVRENMMCTNPRCGQQLVEPFSCSIHGSFLHRTTTAYGMQNLHEPQCPECLANMSLDSLTPFVVDITKKPDRGSCFRYKCPCNLTHDISSAVIANDKNYPAFIPCGNARKGCQPCQGKLYIHQFVCIKSPATCSRKFFSISPLEYRVCPLHTKPQPIYKQSPTSKQSSKMLYTPRLYQTTTGMLSMSQFPPLQ